MSVTVKTASMRIRDGSEMKDYSMLVSPTDSELSETSTNPVQNKVIKAAIETINQDIASQDTKKLDKPSSTLSTSDVGKRLVIESVNADGTFTCKWDDLPIASSTQLGVVKPSITDGISVNSSGLMSVYKAEEANITARKTVRPIVPTNLDFATRKAISAPIGTTAHYDSTTGTYYYPAYTDDEKAAACERLGAYYPEKEWVLKGTIAGTEDDRGNIDDGVTVDLTGCTEVIIKGNVTATGASWFIAAGSSLVNGLTTNGSRTIKIEIKNGLFGITSSGKYYGSLNAGSLGTLLTCYDNQTGRKVSDINSFTFQTPSVVTSCDIKIYAR